MDIPPSVQAKLDEIQGYIAAFDELYQTEFPATLRQAVEERAHPRSALIQLAEYSDDQRKEDAKRMITTKSAFNVIIAYKDDLLRAETSGPVGILFAELAAIGAALQWMIDNRETILQTLKTLFLLLWELLQDAHADFTENDVAEFLIALVTHPIDTISSALNAIAQLIIRTVTWIVENLSLALLKKWIPAIGITALLIAARRIDDRSTHWEERMRSSAFPQPSGQRYRRRKRTVK